MIPEIGPLSVGLLMGYCLTHIEFARLHSPYTNNKERSMTLYRDPVTGRTLSADDLRREEEL